MKAYDILTTYARENLAGYLAGLFLVAVASFLPVIVPWQLGLFADRFGRGTLTPDDAAIFALGIAAVCLVRIILWWLGCDVILRKGRKLMYQLRKRLLDTWSSMPAGFYHDRSTGDLLSHALSDVEVVRELVSMELCMTISGLSLLVSVMCMMVIHGDWRLTIAGLGPLLVIPLFVKMLGPGLRRLSRRCQEALGGMAETVEEVFSGIRTVRAFGNEQVVIKRFKQKVDQIVDEQIRFIRLSAGFEALITLLANAAFVIVLGYGGLLVVTGGIGIGELVAFTLYVGMLRNPLVHLGKALNLLQRSAASLGRIALLLDAAPDIPDRVSVRDCRQFRGEVRINNLNFFYPGAGKDVLRDVSFSVAPGETVGIVGQVGSGKTTLTNLLLRLYDPPRGTVFIDGGDILDYPLETVRSGITCAPQDTYLFSTSILENIAYSDDVADAARAEQAAVAADLHATIMHFPQGYATETGERGVRLSGGQKQRLAIARMEYRKSPVRILDDCLSAVDTATEQRILKNLTDAGSAVGDHRESEPQATIIISHRLSSVRHANEVLVLDGGRIVERGKHEELIRKNGHYAGLWRMQGGQEKPVAETCFSHNHRNLDTEVERIGGASETKTGVTGTPQQLKNAGVPRILLPYMQARQWHLVLVLLLVTSVMAVEMVQPYLVKEVIDHHLTASRPGGKAIIFMVAAYVATILLASGLTYWQEITIQNIGLGCVREIRMRLFSHLQRLSLRYFDRNNTGSIITNIVNDTETLNGFFRKFLPANLRGFLSLAVIMFFMLEMNVRLAFSCLLLIPVIFLFSIYFRIRLRVINNEIRNHLSRVISFLTESVSGMATIRIFQQESKHRKLFDDRNRALREAIGRENRMTLFLNCTTELTGDLGLAALVWFGGCSVSRGAITFGVLYAFIGYIHRLCRPINSITQQVAMLQSSLVAAERIARTMAIEPEGVEDPRAMAPLGQGQVCFEKVSFAYTHGQPVLDNVSIVMPPGSRTGLVGASGAGKTTLANLLARFYEATEGMVLIDGKDIRKWPKGALRNMVGIVQQDVTLFAGSIIDNVRFFRKDIPEARVCQACRLVGAESFILSLPAGYDTVLSERGCSLSLGQRQLLAFARVMVFDPRILILDEATASLDSKTELVVQEAVHRVSLGRTLLIIAHRLSTVRKMDTIVVLDKGRIVETGAHDELMRQRGRYHYLYTSGSMLGQSYS